jgi:hypothetical protein
MPFRERGGDDPADEHGLGHSLATATMSSAIASANGSANVVSMTRIASMVGASTRMVSVLRSMAGRARIWAVTSTGSRAAPKGGISASTRFRASGGSSGMSKPWRRHSSARIPHAPPDVDTIPTRRPPGGGCQASATEASKSAGMSPTRTARLPQRRGPHGVVAGQDPRMRADGRLRLRIPAGLVDHDRLARGARARGRRKASARPARPPRRAPSRGSRGRPRAHPRSRPGRGRPGFRPIRTG